MSKIQETRPQLQARLAQFQEQNEQLENDVDYWMHEHNELLNQVEELKEQVNKSKNRNNLKCFIEKLKHHNLLTHELENFIDIYMRFYN